MLRRSFILVLSLCVFALAPCFAQDTFQQEAAKPKQQQSHNAQEQTIPVLVNDVSSSESTNGTHGKSPHWYTSPEWWLFIIALPTLFFIWYEAAATARAAKATERSADASRDSVAIARLQTETSALDMRRLNRAYLTVGNWTVTPLPIESGKGRIAIEFAIYNPSRTAARLEGIEYQVGTEHFSDFPHFMLTPGERYYIRIPTREVTETDCVFTMRGRITYRDIFRKERHRTFSQGLKVAPSNMTFYQTNAIGANDEEEWDKDD